MTKEQLEKRAEEQVKLKEKREQRENKENTEPQMAGRQISAMAIQTLIAQNNDLQERLNDAYAMVDAAVKLTTLSETIISEQRELINNYKELLNMR